MIDCANPVCDIPCSMHAVVAMPEAIKHASKMIIQKPEYLVILFL